MKTIKYFLPILFIIVFEDSIFSQVNPCSDLPISTRCFISYIKYEEYEKAKIECDKIANNLVLSKEPKYHYFKGILYQKIFENKKEQICNLDSALNISFHAYCKSLLLNFMDTICYNYDIIKNPDNRNQFINKLLSNFSKIKDDEILNYLIFKLFPEIRKDLSEYNPEIFKDYIQLIDFINLKAHSVEYCKKFNIKKISIRDKFKIVQEKIEKKSSDWYYYFDGNKIYII